MVLQIEMFWRNVARNVLKNYRFAHRGPLYPTKRNTSHGVVVADNQSHLQLEMCRESSLKGCESVFMGGDVVAAVSRGVNTTDYLITALITPISGRQLGLSQWQRFQKLELVPKLPLKYVCCVSFSSSLLMRLFLARICSICSLLWVFTWESSNSSEDV